MSAHSHSNGNREDNQYCRSLPCYCVNAQYGEETNDKEYDTDVFDEFGFHDVISLLGGIKKGSVKHASHFPSEVNT